MERDNMPAGLGPRWVIGNLVAPQLGFDGKPMFTNNGIIVKTPWKDSAGRNIDADPLFADPVNGNVRLQPGSPCIDAGHNWGVPPELPAGTSPRVRGKPSFAPVVLADLTLEDPVLVLGHGLRHRWPQTVPLLVPGLDHTFGFLAVRWWSQRRDTLDADFTDLHGLIIALE